MVVDDAKEENAFFLLPTTQTVQGGVSFFGFLGIQDTGTIIVGSSSSHFFVSRNTWNVLTQQVMS